MVAAHLYVRYRIRCWRYGTDAQAHRVSCQRWTHSNALDTVNKPSTSRYHQTSWWSLQVYRRMLTYGGALLLGCTISMVVLHRKGYRLLQSAVNGVTLHRPHYNYSCSHVFQLHIMYGCSTLHAFLLDCLVRVLGSSDILKHQLCWTSSAVQNRPVSVMPLQRIPCRRPVKDHTWVQLCLQCLRVVSLVLGRP